MAAKLTIIIPVYSQVELCRQCLRSLDLQSRKDFQVVLIDDCGGGNYEKLAKEFPGLQVSVVKNKVNLGAIRNIFHAIFYPADTEYVMAMHEDDLLHGKFVEYALAELESNGEAVFMGCSFRSFEKAEDAGSLLDMPAVPGSAVYDRPGFVRLLLKGFPFAFGSVVYRAGAVRQASQPDLPGLSVSCDRPFLLELMRGGKCLVLKDDLYLYRLHGINDSRGKDLSHRHAFNLFTYYRSVLPENLTVEDERLFYTSSTNELLLTYHTLFPGKKPSPLSYIREGRKHGLIQLRLIKLKGLFGLFAMLAGYRLSYKILSVISTYRKNRHVHHQ